MHEDTRTGVRRVGPVKLLKVRSFQHLKEYRLAYSYTCSETSGTCTVPNLLIQCLHRSGANDANNYYGALYVCPTKDLV